MQRKKNPGELPLYDVNSIELKNYSTLEEGNWVPECHCEDNSFSVQSSSREKKKKRFRGGGQISLETSL